MGGWLAGGWLFRKVVQKRKAGILIARFGEAGWLEEGNSL